MSLKLELLKFVVKLKNNILTFPREVLHRNKLVYFTQVKFIDNFKTYNICRRAQKLFQEVRRYFLITKIGQECNKNHFYKDK